MNVVYDVGVDEAGRGPLFGRVYTAAVVLGETVDTSLLKDSKKFHSAKKLKHVADHIREHALAWSVTYSDEKQIDNLNVLHATIDSMHRSVRGLLEKDEMRGRDVRLLIDGNYFKPMFRDDDGKVLAHTCIEHGDAEVGCISAASILAKDARDTYILELCEEHPMLKEKYMMHKHKGYGTKAHMDALALHGPTEWHRMSFGPCSGKIKEKPLKPPSYPLFEP